jgi:enamine deaminase RidA (YjgF/YER057c/UK114 family)
LTTPYERLQQLGLELPRPTTPLANYVPFVMANGFLYLSGQGPRRPDGSLSTGKVGATVSTEQAYLDAQLTPCPTTPTTPRSSMVAPTCS